MYPLHLYRASESFGCRPTPCRTPPNTLARWQSRPDERRKSLESLHEMPSPHIANANPQLAMWQSADNGKHDSSGEHCQTQDATVGPFPTGPFHSLILHRLKLLAFFPSLQQSHRVFARATSPLGDWFRFGLLPIFQLLNLSLECLDQGFVGG
jgi:hypothetical protein